MWPPAKTITISTEPIASGAIGLAGLILAVAVPTVKTKMKVPMNSTASLRFNAATCASGSERSSIRCSTRTAGNLPPRVRERPRTAIRTCPLCEATCGLEITLDGDQVASIRGDREDVFSHGFLCPKGFALKELHDDPDRIRTPLIRRPDGSFAAASWDEAFELHRRAPVADPRRATATRSPCTSATRTPTTCCEPALRPGAAARARHPQPLLGEHRRPVPQADGERADVRHRHDGPGPRRRPHRLPADARRQPARSRTAA